MMPLLQYKFLADGEWKIYPSNPVAVNVHVIIENED